MKILNLNEVIQESVSHNTEIKKRVLIKNGEVPNLTNFSQAYFKQGQISNAHAHKDMYEVFFVEQGSGVIKINRIVHYIKPGTCLVVGLNEVHEIIAEEDLVLTYFGIQTCVK